MLKQMNKGRLFILSGPSGCGKGTVCKVLLEKNKNLKLSISATTREKRVGEIDGETYFYLSKDQFEDMIKNDELLEFNQGYSGNYYGTPKKYVFDQLEKGFDVLLEIEMNGAKNIKEKYPESIGIFLSPPSFDELLNRLRGRGRESEELIQERFLLAKEEILRVDEYKYAVINEDLNETVDTIVNIINAEKHLTSFIGNKIKSLVK
ncbi:MAG: guanylate kinase [Clostridiales bacterium]|nr:guanylate kinase [Clostridiales bacterium]